MTSPVIARKATPWAIARIASIDGVRAFQAIGRGERAASLPEGLRREPVMHSGQKRRSGQTCNPMKTATPAPRTDGPRRSMRSRDARRLTAALVTVTAATRMFDAAKARPMTGGRTRRSAPTSSRARLRNLRVPAPANALRQTRCRGGHACPPAGVEQNDAGRGDEDVDDRPTRRRRQPRRPHRQDASRMRVRAATTPIVASVLGGRQRAGLAVGSKERQPPRPRAGLPGRGRRSLAPRERHDDARPGRGKGFRGQLPRCRRRRVLELVGVRLHTDQDAERPIVLETRPEMNDRRQRDVDEILALTLEGSGRKPHSRATATSAKRDDGSSWSSKRAARRAASARPPDRRMTAPRTAAGPRLETSLESLRSFHRA